MADGSLTFDTKIESESFNKGMDDLNKSAKTGFEKMASTVSDKIGITDIALGNMLGNLAGNLIGGAINNAGKFISDSIEIASNLAEVQNVVDTTFEGSAGDINKWAKAAKEAYGMSELKAKKYASTIGSMFKSMGLADDQVLSMSEGITGLAGDMASFYNLDHDTAFEKLRAGISGETEPLKQLGINMSVANLEAFALSEGITKSYNSMSQAEQTTLRYNYLMKATADAQGDFSRTSDGYANQQRILATTMEELSATVGSIFLPAVTAGVKGLNVLATGAKGVVSAIANIFNPPKDELTKAVGDAKDALTGFSSATDTINGTLDTSLATIAANQTLANSLLTSYQQILDKEKLTDTDVARLQTLAGQVITLYPEMATYIDENTGLFNTNTTAIRNNIDTLTGAAQQTAYLTASAELQQVLLDNMVGQTNAQVAYQNAYDAWRDKATELTAVQAISDAISTNAGSIEQYAAQLIMLSDNFKQYFETNEDGVFSLNSLGVAAMANGEIQTQLEFAIVGVQAAEEKASATAAEAGTSVKQYGTDIEATQRQIEEYAAAGALLNGSMNGTVPATDTARGAVDKYGRSVTQVTDRLAIDADRAKNLNPTLIKTIDNAKASTNATQAAIDKDKELAELTTTIANNIDAAAAKGQNAVVALQNQHTFITNEAAGIVTEIENLATDLGLYVEAMKNAMIDIIAKSETDAAAAGEKVAKGTSDGYKKTPYLRTAVQSSVVQSVAVIQAYFNAFENAGYGIASNMASGVRSGSSELSGAVSAIVKSALSAARTAAGATSGTSSASGRYATGLYSVPYNGFVLEAHKEERILTAQEAKYVPRDVTSIGQATPVIDIEALAAAVKSGNDGVIHISFSIGDEVVADVLEPRISELQGKRLRLKG